MAATRCSTTLRRTTQAKCLKSTSLRHSDVSPWWRSWRNSWGSPSLPPLPLTHQVRLKIKLEYMYTCMLLIVHTVSCAGLCNMMYSTCMCVYIHVFSSTCTCTCTCTCWYSICLECRRSRVRVPPEAALLFLWKKKELSSGVVACICLVSITDYSCMYIYMCTGLCSLQLCTYICTYGNECGLVLQSFRSFWMIFV